MSTKSASLLTPTVNLPPLLIAHAIGMSSLGLYFVLRPPPSTPSRDPFKIPGGRAHEISSLLGIITSCLGLTYFWTSYMPLQQNQFLYASVPVRLFVAGMAGGKLLLERARGYGISEEGRRELLGIVVYDTIGAGVLGWWLGTWGGRTPGYQA